MNEIYFDHEKLKVYQKAIEFVGWVHKLLVGIKTKSLTNDQFERAADSIALNIAEGNGKYSSKDRCRYFDILKASALESAACIDLLFVKQLIDESKLLQGKQQLKEIISMIVGLIKSNSDRVYEQDEDYGSN